MNTKIKFLIILTITIFGLLCISNISNAAYEIHTSGNFNYIIDENSYTEPVVIIESLNDYSIEELRIPKEIDGIKVHGIESPTYVEENTYSYILTDAKNLKRIIIEDPVNWGYVANRAIPIEIEEIIIDKQVIDYLVFGYDFEPFAKSVKIKGYGHTLVQDWAEQKGYTYESIGENEEPLLISGETYVFGLNAYTENLVIPEKIKTLDLINGKRVIAGSNLTWKDEFNINATAAIKTIKFEGKEVMNIKDQSYFSGVETVYGYEGTGVETFAANIGAEFVSLGKVEVEKFLYDIVEDENERYIAIKGINGAKPKEVEFPEYINGLPVRVIKKNTIPIPGYKQVSDVLSIIIPETVRKVEYGAFSGCMLQELKVYSKEIEYLDELSCEYDTGRISWRNNCIIYAYDESGLKEKNDSSYKYKYVSLNENLSYTTEETEDLTVDNKKVTILPVIKETNIIDFIIKDKFPSLNNGNIKVTDKAGNPKANTDKLGSRNVIKVEDGNGNILAEFTVVVRGDVTGNGYARMYDAFQILKDTIIPGVSLDAIDIRIRDYSGDGNVRMYDAFQFLKDSILN